MTDTPKTRLFRILMLPLLLGALGAQASIDETTYLYSVWYNDKRIGEHEFVIARSQDGVRVRSEVTMEFRVLFVPVYQYSHVARERWQGECLTSLDSETNDNGKRYALQATAVPAGMTLQQTAPETRLRQIESPDCLASFAYWDLARLRQEQLLNTQTGDLAPVSLTAVGQETLDGVSARRYALQAEGLGTIHLWYRERDDLWLRLETERDGASLVYRLEAERASTQLARLPGPG